MRIIAAILNIALILFVLYILMTRGAPEGNDVPFAVLLFAAPIVNLIAILTGRVSEGNGLFSLYLQRKRLEELQRIEKLRSKSGA
jgi:hypothetical protein